MAAGIVGELDVPDAIELLLDRADEIALHDLGVVEVVLQPEVLRSSRCEDRQSDARAVDKEPRNVAAVDRLEEEADLRRLELLRGILQVLDQHAAGSLRRDPARRDSGQTIELRTAESPGVVDRLHDALAKFRDAVRLAGYSPVAARPVAGREIMENELEAVVLQRGGDVARR